MTFEALGYELLARASHRPRHERRWTDLAQATGRQPQWLNVEARHFGPLLSDQEIDDLGSVYHKTRDTMLPPPKATLPPWVVPTPTPDYSLRALQHGGEFMSELLKLTGCEAKPDRTVIAEVHYRPDGRPSQIAIAPGNVPEPCLRAARVLFALTAARAAKPMAPTFTDALVLSLEPQRKECVEVATSSSSDSSESSMPVRPGGLISQPKKIEHVKPVYPVEARRKRIEGVVLIEGTISRAGCMSEMAVVSSPDPLLSAAALSAVKGWRYRPTLLDNVAVPVIMTITVNFWLTP